MAEDNSFGFTGTPAGEEKDCFFPIAFCRQTENTVKQPGRGECDNAPEDNFRLQFWNQFLQAKDILWPWKFF